MKKAIKKSTSNATKQTMRHTTAAVRARPLITIYMGLTANGYIASPDDRVDFVSKESWRSYKKQIQAHDAVVVGRRTYELMPRQEFNQDKTYIVCTHTGINARKTKRLIVTQKPVRYMLDDLLTLGLKKILISGGAATVSQFLPFADRIILDIEPTLMGQGIPLISHETVRVDLHLLSVKKLSDHTVQLVYKHKK